MPSFIISTTIAFFSTTIDDFAIMLYFFALAENEKTPAAKRLQYVKVVAGQTIGFSIVILVSLIGFVLGLFIPEDYVDLIGVIPIIAGLMKLHEVLDEEGYLDSCPTWCRASSGDGDGKDDKPDSGKYTPVTTAEEQAENGLSKSAELTGGPTSSYNNPAVIAPTTMHRGEGEDADDDDNKPPADTSEGNIMSKAFSTLCQSCIDPFTREVTVMALICSSDNVAIYIAIFATEKKWEVFLTIIMFYLLLTLNIVAAIALMKVRTIAPSLPPPYSLFGLPLLPSRFLTPPPSPPPSLAFSAVPRCCPLLPGLLQVLHPLLPHRSGLLHLER